MDYLTGWEEGNDIGTSGEALVKDYINNTVWNMPVTNIAIVRHQKKNLDFAQENLDFAHILQYHFYPYLLDTFFLL